MIWRGRLPVGMGRPSPIQPDPARRVYIAAMQPSTQSAAARIDSSRATGRQLVAALLVVGAALACFAIWFQWQQTRRCLSFYGSDAARRIQYATRVELWEPSAASADAPAALESAVHTDISRAAGLVHLRRGLVEDANFDWQRAADAGDAWDAALAFYDPAAATPATVLVIDFDPAGSTLGVAGSERRVGLGRIEKGLRSWLGDIRAKK